MPPSGVQAGAAVPSRWPAWIVDGIIAAVLLAVVFPGVIFFGGSLAASNITPVVDRSKVVGPVTSYPQPEGQRFSVGFADVGAPAWQMDPAAGFLRRSIATGETPFWNPFSASGSVGPETLADTKFGVQVVLAALLGADALAITVSTLLVLLAGSWAIQLYLRRFVGLERLATTAAATFYVANGFAMGYLGSQVGAPYALFPLVLLAAAHHAIARGRLSFALSVGAHVAVLATTFVPTAAIALLGVHVLVLATPQVARTSRAVVDQLLPAGMALLLLAFLWLPNLVHLTRSADLDLYTGRSVRSRGLREYVSLFTPFHAWDGRSPGTFPAGVQWTSYVGVSVAALWAGGTVRRSPSRLHKAAVALVLVGVVFAVAVPGAAELLALPGLRSVRTPYWGAMVAIGGTVLTGLAIARLRDAGASLVGVAGAGAVLVGLFAYTVAVADRVEGVSVGDHAVIVAALLTTAVVLLALTRAPRWRAAAVAAAAVLIALELLATMNHTRPRRADLDDPPTAYVTFLRDHLGPARILNLGKPGIYPDWGSALAIRQAGSLNLGQMPWYREFYQRHISSEKGLFLAVDRGVDQPLNEEAIDALAVRYLVVNALDPDLVARVEGQYETVFEDPAAGVQVMLNADARPRAYVSHGLAAVDEPVDPGSLEVAVTEDRGALEQARTAGVPQRADSWSSDVQLTRDGHATVEMTVDTNRPGVLVLADTFHADWRAYVDGEPADVWRVNGAFRGVLVPPGRATVAFTYELRSMQWVLGVSAVMGLVLGVWMAWRPEWGDREASASVPACRGP